jgi:16S rRNA (uracil1498-N3)-methyltransferase
MTRRRWIADEVLGDRAVLVGEHAHHLAQVLRAQMAQEFEIATGNQVRLGRITSIRPNRVEFELGEVLGSAAESPITVALSIFKFERMEWAIEKCTELGVARIIPLVAGRTESHLAAAAVKRVERWQRIARQAAEQSRRASPPEISEPLSMKQLLAMPAEARIFLSESEAERMLKDSIPARAASVLLSFGPEGGWKEQELAAFKDNGWASVSLGPTILRAETAIIAAVAVCQSLLGAGALPTGKTRLAGG